MHKPANAHTGQVLKTGNHCKLTTWNFRLRDYN